MATGSPPLGAGVSCRVLVAGATGLVGRALLSELLGAAPGSVQVHALRRPHRQPSKGEVSARPGLVWHDVDLTALPPLPSVDEAYIALGTTIAQAGSRAAFRAVDLDAVLAVARAARNAGAERLGVVSAHGANPASSVFYNRVKGEMEEAVATLGYASVCFAQPSLLLGDRQALGQPRRPAEQWGSRLLLPFSRLLPRNLRPIEAADVARALVRAVRAAEPGVRRLASSQMQA